MAFYINGGNGLVIGLGDSNHDGRLDIDVGLRSFNAYGNGWSGGSSSAEIGFNSARGAYVGGSQTNWNPWSRESSSWRTDGFGTQGQNTYADVAGNYANNRYANDVFGNFYRGSTQANRYGYQNMDTSGNFYSGGQVSSGQWGDAWGRGGNWAGGVPAHGHRHWGGCGGCQARGWFGGY